SRATPTRHLPAPSPPPRGRSRCPRTSPSCPTRRPATSSSRWCAAWNPDRAGSRTRSVCGSAGRCSPDGASSGSTAPGSGSMTRWPPAAPRTREPPPRTPPSSPRSASGLRRPRRPSASGGHRPPTASAERDDRLARDLLERRPVRVAVDDETPALALAGDAALRRALLTAAQQAAGGALELELLLDGTARDRGGEHRGAQPGRPDQRAQLAVRGGVRA